MNIDLGSPVLDIAIGLSFVFFLLSLIASAITEAFAWARKLRAKTLREGLEGMLGDKKLVTRIFEHPLIRTDIERASDPNAPSGRREAGPSYVSPRNFARAFREVAKDDQGCVPAPVAKQIEALGVNVQHVDTAPTVTLEKWFEDAMDRVNGWYKRKAQKITLVIALVVAFGLNASAVRIVEHLDEEPTVRAAVVAQAEAATPEKTSKGSIQRAGKAASSAYQELEALKIPIFWAKANVPQSVAAVAVALIGCLLTTIAISLGAPFWFDTLTKLSNLRATGKKPAEGAEKSG